MARKSSNNVELNKLRAEARKRRNAATRKIARNRREKGINVAGSEYDPRKSPDAIERMNTSQLNSYIKRLNNFTSRDTQFISTGGGPVSRRDWAKFKAAETKANTRSAIRAKRVGNLKLPIGDMTISEREASIFGDKRVKRADGSVINSPFPSWDHKPEQMNGPEALRQMQKAMMKQTSPERQRSNMRSWRGSALKMLEELGLQDMTLELEELTDKQFEALWLGGFAHKLQPLYTIFKTRNAGRKSRWYDDASSDQAEQIKLYVDWAQRIK